MQFTLPLAVALLGHWIAARLLGLRFLKAPQVWRAALWRRLTVWFAGPLLAYAVAAALAFGIDDPQGRPTLVVDVLPASGAARAGMRSGDRLLEIDGSPVTTWNQFKSAAEAARPAPVKVGFERDGGRRILLIERIHGRLGLMARSQRATLAVRLRSAAWHPARTSWAMVVAWVSAAQGRPAADAGGYVMRLDSDRSFVASFVLGLLFGWMSSFLMVMLLVDAALFMCINWRVRRPAREPR